MTTFCSSCGQTCEEPSQFCPHCGVRQTDPPPTAGGQPRDRGRTRPGGGVHADELTDGAGGAPTANANPAEGSPRTGAATTSVHRFRLGTVVVAVTVIAVAVVAGVLFGEQVGASGKTSGRLAGKAPGIDPASERSQTVPRSSIESLVGCWTSPPKYAQQSVVVWPTGDGRITYVVKDTSARLHLDFEGLDVVRPGRATAIVTSVDTGGRQLDLEPVSAGTQINFAFLPAQQYGRAFQVSNPAVPGVTSIIYYYTSRPPAVTDTQACHR